MTMKIVAVLTMCSFFVLGLAYDGNKNTNNQNKMGRIIIQKATLNCSAEKAFEMFTDNKYLESWLTAEANVEPIVGGKYELFWEPDDPENNSTIGCKILAIEKPDYLNFEWKGPKQFKHFMNNARPLTNVTVIFAKSGDQANVTLIHTGWRDTDEWENAREYFINAWKGAFIQLEKYFNREQRETLQKSYTRSGLQCRR